MREGSSYVTDLKFLVQHDNCWLLKCKVLSWELFSHDRFCVDVILCQQWNIIQPSRAILSIILPALETVSPSHPASEHEHPSPSRTSSVFQVESCWSLLHPDSEHPSENCLWRVSPAPSLTDICLPTTITGLHVTLLLQYFTSLWYCSSSPNILKQYNLNSDIRFYYNIFLKFKKCVRKVADNRCFELNIQYILCIWFC